MIGIGSRVSLVMGINGTIIAYNNNVGIYGSDRFPYIIKRDDGYTFEYSEDDIIKVIRYKHLEVSNLSLSFFPASVLNAINQNPRQAIPITEAAYLIMEVGYL